MAGPRTPTLGLIKQNSILIDPDLIKEWLEWAGLRAVAIRVHRTHPSSFRTYWPDFSQDKWEILDFRERLSLKAPSPPPNEITLMDIILKLPSLCSTHGISQVLQLRSLIHPIYGRHLKSWDAIALRLHKDRKTVRAWHKAGLKQIADRIPPDTTHDIVTRFGGYELV